jgi:lipoprotein NlpI
MEAHYNLGVVLLELGIYGEAVTAFYNTLILRPTMFEAWLNLGAYRAREQLPRRTRAHFLTLFLCQEWCLSN